jgi:hypothetical protein
MALTLTESSHDVQELAEPAEHDFATIPLGTA